MNEINLANSLLGNFAKVNIIAYKSPNYSENFRTGQGFFLAQVNPETYSIGYRPNYNSQGQASGTSTHDSPWSHNEPRTISLEFLFDGTGAVPHPMIAGGQEVVGALGDATGNNLDTSIPTAGNELEGINEAVSRALVLPQIQLFENTVYHVQGDTHVPNYLMISWGSLLFKCRLSQMDINYKLFTPEGLPLRATISASFKETIPERESAKKKSLRSPDITHLETVKQGDTLPIMAKRIYGDERYYISVAQANNIIDFRRLEPGQRLYFPPISKG